MLNRIFLLFCLILIQGCAKLEVETLPSILPRSWFGFGAAGKFTSGGHGGAQTTPGGYRIESSAGSFYNGGKVTTQGGYTVYLSVQGLTKKSN